jgi:hypothetical protein
VVDEPTGLPHAYKEVVPSEVFEGALPLKGSNVVPLIGTAVVPTSVIFTEEVQSLEKLLLETLLTV